MSSGPHGGHREILAARKLHLEARIVHGQDLWTWLAVADSDHEQNPVELAQHPFAKMQDGKRKEHSLEPLCMAIIERLHDRLAPESHAPVLSPSMKVKEWTG
jgi:hypothetical protein